jgi:hypothetical protein
MKKIAIAAASFFAIAASPVFAQTSTMPMDSSQPALVSVPASQTPLTRPQVKNQLKNLEAAGYQPSEDRADYPANVQAAEQSVAQMQVASAGAQQLGTAATTMDSEGYDGGTVVQSGGPVNSGCQGPASVCSVYYGGR